MPTLKGPLYAYDARFTTKMHWNPKSFAYVHEGPIPGFWSHVSEKPGQCRRELCLGIKQSWEHHGKEVVESDHGQGGCQVEHLIQSGEQLDEPREQMVDTCPQFCSPPLGNKRQAQVFISSPAFGIDTLPNCISHKQWMCDWCCWCGQ